MPVVSRETSEPELESRAMKKKQTETKSRCGFGLTRHLIGGVLCLAANQSDLLQSVGAESVCGRCESHRHLNGNIDEFTPNGVRSAFAAGLTSPFAHGL